MNCVLYGNCQAEYLMKILKKSLNFTRIYKNIEHIANYELIRNNKQLPLNIISHADLFIYQPVNNNHDKLASDYIINNILKKECKIISFPYIYNSAISIFDKKGDYKKIFINLFKDGHSLESVLTKFKNLEIDFNFKNRFINTMNILKERESNLDIKVHQYILNNFGKKKLFISEPHPTIHIYYQCIIQIFKIINLTNDLSFELTSSVLDPELNEELSKELDPTRAYKLHFGLIEKIPKTPYEINFNKLEWKKEPDTNWYDHFAKYIKNIYLETLSMND